MKILIISGLYYPVIGGAEREAQKIAEILIRKEINVSVLTQYLKNYPEYEVINNVKIYRKIKAFRPWGLTYFMSVLYFLIKVRKTYDIIICFGLFYYTPAAVIIKLLFKKRVLNRLECAGEKGDLKRIDCIKYKFLIKSLWRHVDRFIAITDDIASELKEAGIEEKKIIRIANSVDINKFIPKNESKEVRNTTQLLFIGRLTEQKGIDILLEAINRVIKKGGDVNVKIIGDGELRKQLEILSNQLGIYNYVKFEGIQENVMYWYLNSDILIIPSRYEGLPLVLLEGMACGVPIIASNIPAHREVLKDGITGIIFEKENIKQLSDKIEYLIQNPQVAKEIGKRGREMVISKYSLEKISEKYIELFKSIMKE